MTDVAIRRPVAATMLFLSIGILGLVSYGDLPVELLPDIETAIITVQTIYANAAPSEVERLITEPIEDAVSSVNGVDTVTSRTVEGVSFVTIQFVEGTNEAEAVADVRDRISAMSGTLPKDAEDPIVGKFDIQAAPVLLVGVSADRPSRIVRTTVEQRVKDRLTSVPGVASVSVGGGETREIQIQLAQDRLKALGLTIPDVRAQLVAQNLDLPGGRVDEGRREYTVRVLGEFKTVDEIHDVMVKLPEDHGEVKLTELGNVADTIADVTSTTRVNGRDSVGMSVQKTSLANTVDVCEGVRKAIAQLKEELPRDFSFVVTRDESTFTEDSLHDLRFSLYAGVIMAVLVVFMFLRSVRATAIIGMAIPTSLLATFIPMDFTRQSLNIMSMMGLALAVGILVDDSIVVLENIYRHVAMGKPIRVAALEGRMEIGMAAVAITMVDVVVYIPIALMKGIVGQFFRPFGLTVAFATLFSLLVSFTLTPMLASRWLRREGAMHAGEEDVAERAVRRRTLYVRALDFVIRGWRGGARFVVAIGGIVVLVVVGSVVGRSLGFQFMTDSDQGEASVFVEMPTGVRIEETDAVIREIEARVSGMPEVDSYFAQAGRSDVDTGSQYGQISLKLIGKAGWLARHTHKPGEFVTRKDGTQQRVGDHHYTIDRLGPMLADIPAAKVRVGAGGHGFSQFELRLIGRPEDGLGKTHDRVLAALGQVKELAGVSTTWKPGKPEVQARIDRRRAGDFGYTVQEVAMAVRTAVEGDTSTEFRESGIEYDVRIRLREEDRLGPDEVGNILVGLRNGHPVLLKDVASISYDRGPVQIDHIDGEQYVPVTAVSSVDPTTGKPYASSAAEVRVREAMNSIPMPPGIRWRLGGEAEIRGESFGYMGQSMVLSILLVFILLSALYESCFFPIVIMVAVPMAAVGGLLGLKAAGATINIMGLVGFIMLIGMVAKNGILLVDYTNTMRSRGMARNDALLRSGPTRFRPIMMTSLALVFALLPIAMGIGRGAEMRQPMAAAVTGGMILSTLLTLLMVPAWYTILDDVQQRIYSPVKARLFGRPRDDDGAQGAASSSRGLAEGADPENDQVLPPLG